MQSQFCFFAIWGRKKKHVLKVSWLFKHFFKEAAGTFDSILINFGTYLGKSKSQQVSKDSLRLNKQVSLY